MVTRIAMDDRELTNRFAADHVTRTRERLAAGRAELARQREAVSATEKHLSGMKRWIEQTDRELGNERARRSRHGDNSADA
jgi:predicted  nucleic acid-binding Zn-ribbon protein